MHRAVRYKTLFQVLGRMWYTSYYPLELSATPLGHRSLAIYCPGIPPPHLSPSSRVPLISTRLVMVVLSPQNEQAHAVLLEERLQQTLEREAALNAEVEAQTSSARDGERRVARAIADAARARAAAAAQVQAELLDVLAYGAGQEGRGGRRKVFALRTVR